MHLAQELAPRSADVGVGLAEPRIRVLPRWAWVVPGREHGVISSSVRDLEQTRAYAVDDSAARLRGIERDLHDGTQAQLVAVAMKLGLARKKLGTGDDGSELDLERTRELVDAAHRSAKEAIADVRDLARGIHPPVLDTGLDAALATLAARSTVPVD